jgi:hypothetical protein
MKTRRTTLRALMIAVALAALASFGWVLRQRSARFASEAEKHYHRMALCLANRNSMDTEAHTGIRRRPEVLTGWRKEKRAYFESWASYEEQLISKYRWAAIFPWVSPEDDPPPPSPFHSWLY